jgi:hypothetical protein
MKWLMIDNGSEVRNFIEISNDDKVYSNNNIFIGNTQEEAFTEIENRGLSFIFTSGDTKEIVFSGGGRTIRDIILNND